MTHGEIESRKLHDKCKTKFVLLGSSKPLLRLSAPKYKEGDLLALLFRKKLPHFFPMSGAPVVWYEIINT